jgi:prolyl oligopeptidase
MVIAARLVVDAGMHYFGWTRAQCRDYLARVMPLSLAEIEADLDRIGQDEPGESLAAGMGAREMRAYRRWLTGELGPDFDVNAFHQEMLSLGPVPLPALGTHLEWWVWQERTQRR